jgi:hypothetical protein
MTQEELFISEGAWYHCARLIYRNKDVGVRAEDGTVSLLPEGEEIYARLSQITDVEVKPAKTRVKKVEVTQVAEIDELLEKI